MELRKVAYADLNARQQEIYNFQIVAGRLALYGFNCMKLADDWQGADFLAYHKDGADTLKVQLKGRLLIARKYVGKDLYMTFPLKDDWYLLGHDALVDLVGSHTKWLATESWTITGEYHSKAPHAHLVQALGPYRL